MLRSPILVDVSSTNDIAPRRRSTREGVPSWMRTWGVPARFGLASMRAASFESCRIHDTSMHEDARLLVAALFPTTKPTGDRPSGRAELMRMKEEEAADMLPRLGFEAPTGSALPVVVRP